HMNLTERFAKCAAPEAIRPAASWITRSALPVSKRETVRILSSFSTQWSRFIEYFGRAPDFIDGHHHIHLLQAPRRALFRLVREKGFKGWLRQCRASSRRAWVQQLILDGPSARFAQCAIATGFCINPGFGGLRVFLRSEDLAKLWQSDLLAMPSGGLLIVHPGTTGSPPGTDVIDLCRVDEAAMLSTGRMRDILQSAHLKLAADARAPGWG
ncbi:MAG: ChbG/HpnK family deacetylase, partial [Methylocella sp.]